MEEESKGSSKISAPSTEIPRRSSLESLFTSGGGSGVCPTSLSHTTLVSNYFPDNYPADGTAEFRSFSQLLAGAMTASPSAGVVGGTVNLFGEYWNHEKEGVMCGDDNNEKEGSVGLGGSYKQNRPGSLMVPPASSAAGGGSISPLFPISPGFSPSLFFNSAGPGFLTPATQSPLGMSHQQALAQVTAQAAAPAQQHHHHHHHHQPQLLPNPPDHHQQYMFSSSLSALLPAPFFTNHHLHLDHHSSTAYDEQQPVPLLHPPKLPRDRKSQSQPQPPPPPLAAPVDKPADDGYNWRKYGQKQVKGSEYPRSYYKCTTPSCPVKKKVERSFDGHITEIIYKGQHNHEPPKNGRRSKDAALSISSLPPGGGGYSTTTIHDQGHHHHHHQWAAAAGDDDSAQAATSLQLHGPSDSEESAGDHDAVQKRLDIHDDQYDEQGGNHKRRNTGDGSYEVGAMSHKTVTEPKIIVQTRSDVDLLDDGYRWRKYGQKVVKGNPNPRSYYKCTTAGCNVRKQVERSSTDSKAVITTYEGKHTHDVPAARHSATITNATAAADTSRHDTTQQQHMNGLSIPFLQLKEEKTK